MYIYIYKHLVHPGKYITKHKHKSWDKPTNFIKGILFLQQFSFNKVDLYINRLFWF